jgi:DnaA family protein
MSAPTGQLPLPVQLESFARFESFVAPEDSPAVPHLRAIASGRERAALWLAGPEGAGKSHLLQACCKMAASAGLRAMYVPVSGAAGLRSGMLAGLESLDLLALDDVEAAAGLTDWEMALFELFNGFLGSRSSIVLAARRAPADAGFALADLRSRAAACVVYRIAALDDAGRQRALIAHAATRGLELDSTAARYLLHRVRRDMRDICLWLERIDQTALVTQRRLTIPLIRDALAGSADELS